MFARAASTGIEELDRLLYGGFTREERHPARGAAGPGRTTLGLHFLLAGVAAGETAIPVASLLPLGRAARVLRIGPPA